MITRAYFTGQIMYITVTNNAKVPSSLKWVNLFPQWATTTEKYWMVERTLRPGESMSFSYGPVRSPGARYLVTAYYQDQGASPTWASTFVTAPARPAARPRPLKAELGEGSPHLPRPFLDLLLGPAKKEEEEGPVVIRA